MRSASLFLVTALFVPIAVAHSQGQKALDIYFIDVEGGQATLFVSPSGESMLVDTGVPGRRDPERIAAVAKRAGLKQIDYLVTTHYHGDHVGGAPALAAKVPIRNFVDHGPTLENTTGDAAHDKDATTLFRDYVAVRDKGHHIQVKPGDKVPIAGIDVQVVSSAGKFITTPLAGGGAPNPLCRDFKPQTTDDSLYYPENDGSVGTVIRYGRFSIVDLGDLTWNKEHDLACPNNLLGTVDVYLTTHHGVSLSGSPLIVHALHPRVAVWNNAARKGGREPFDVLKTSPGLQDIWQLHYSVSRPRFPRRHEILEPGGKDNNSPEEFIANLEPTHDTGPAHLIKISARSDGSFSVTNDRTGFSKEYRGRSEGAR